MSIRNIHKLMALLIIAVSAIAYPQFSQAAGTGRNTSIANRASVDYRIGGVQQTVIRSAPGGNSVPGAAGGADTTFVVDDKVILSIADNSGGVVTTTPGATNQHAMTFAVTNGGNGAHDVVISATELSDNMGGGAGFATVALYEDTNNNGAYNPGVDLAAGAGGAVYLLMSGGNAYIDEMAADATRTIFVVITTPLAAVNGEAANYSLTATAYNDLAQVRAGGTGGSLGNITAANTADADSAGLLDIVLAETAGDGGDAANNGAFTRNGLNGFAVASITLNVQKTSAVISDPVNGGANPKAIPLAILEYTIRVTYTAGSGTATNVDLTDVVPANTLGQVDQYGGTGEVRRTVDDGTGAVTTDMDQAALTAWGTAAGNTITVPCGISLDAVNDFCEIKYRVQIQ